MHPFAAVGKRLSRRSAKYPRRRHERKTMRAVEDAGPYGVRERGHGRANRGTDPSPYEVHDRNGGGTNAG